MAARTGEALAQYDAGVSATQNFAAGADLVLSRISRAIYIGGGGNIQVQFAGDPDSQQPTLTGISAGVWHPMQVQKIINAGTTATGIIVGF